MDTGKLEMVCLLLGLGLAALDLVVFFCCLVTGGLTVVLRPAWAPERNLEDSGGPRVTRRVVEVAVLGVAFMFLSSLLAPGPFDFDSVDLFVSKRRGLAGTDGREVECIVRLMFLGEQQL